MSLNIQPSYPQYRNLAPLAKVNPVQLNQLPSIGSVFPEFFKHRAQSVTPQTPIYRNINTPRPTYRRIDPPKPTYRRIAANTDNFSTNTNTHARSLSTDATTSTQTNNVNYSMPFLYSINGKLRSRLQAKTFIPRRKRVNTQQLTLLNEVFIQNPFPSIEERFKLSERLGISARSIQIWFQNKRQTVRSFSY